MKTLLVGVRELLKASQEWRSHGDNFPSLPSGTAVEVLHDGSLEIVGVGKETFAVQGACARDLLRELAKAHGLEVRFTVSKIEF